MNHEIYFLAAVNSAQLMDPTGTVYIDPTTYAALLQQVKICQNCTKKILRNFRETCFRTLF